MKLHYQAALLAPAPYPEPNQVFSRNSCYPIVCCIKSLTVSETPKVVDLQMLDTDFAQLVEVDPGTAKLTVAIQKQVWWYRQTTRQDKRDNLLYQIATKADLFPALDMEAIDQRTREVGFSLHEDERQFIIDWLKWALEIDLEAQD